MPRRKVHPPALPDLCTRAEFQRENAHLFPSVASLTWAIRCNRTRLIEAGAVLELAGRLLINRPVFATTLLEIGRQRAQARDRYSREEAA